ncbi:hypothetical protein F5887DRAFT_1199388 [Amanita rubescens]|nr:hypothetical protein F5887DRAFT_1199388 [Amanita rubescens]
MGVDEITIPTDVLYDILHLLCDGPIALHDLKNDSHFHEFPWAVGQVCRHWRGAFVSCTHLWTSFTLKPGHFNAAYFAEMNRRTTIYLERSGQRLLTIVVSMPCSGTERFPKTVWKILLSCLTRWKKANLVLGDGSALDELLRCRGFMSSLESLRMSIPDSRALKHYNAFEVAPHLTELDLAHPDYTPKWQFPWAQLTKLKIETSWKEFDFGNNIWGVLFQLNNIEELAIITTSHFPGPLSPRLVILPCLRLLEITLAFANMLSLFNTPLLEHLRVHGYINPAYDHFYDHQPYRREITSLIQRSSCHIRRLTFEDCTMGEMRIIMKALASVEELSINSPSSFAILQEVATGLGGYIYLPKLRVLQATSQCNVRGNQVVRNAVTGLEDVMTVFSSLLEARGKGLYLSSQDIVPLEKFVLRLTLRGKCPDEVLEVVHGWPSFAQVYITRPSN